MGVGVLRVWIRESGIQPWKGWVVVRVGFCRLCRFGRCGDRRCVVCWPCGGRGRSNAQNLWIGPGLIDEIPREGARRVLAAALEAEVEQYIAELAGRRDEAG
ncbi:hypothetical protein ACFYY6_38180, partial [Streptomyces sp. NPDC001750]